MTAILSTVIHMTFLAISSINTLVQGVLIRGMSDAFVTPFFDQLAQAFGIPNQPL